eukprot:scaffold3450_cov114-Cylindrotheca_fusiformis.AAC.41
MDPFEKVFETYIPLPNLEDIPPAEQQNSSQRLGLLKLDHLQNSLTKSKNWGSPMYVSLSLCHFLGLPAAHM